MAARARSPLIAARLAAAACAMVAASTGTAAGQAVATFKSGVEAVRLDVSVMRGGQPVRGLLAEDFIVTDNGVPQRVESVAVKLRERTHTAPLSCCAPVAIHGKALVTDT